ncbi:CLUMA_CG011408, isoform A [Clunio marinus]|uniref:CLUMA_CG011408, isoform A n=1 Tax=Clunio marinus TaxID=568069 RepID=A0A1J1ICM6_9DIPT|nr:CLUMA_CG011408, isoform A [Clunio marinus]
MENKALLLAFCVATLLRAADCGIFPKELPRCNSGDSQCLPGVITQVLRSVKDGNPAINVPAFEPLYVPEVNIVQGPETRIPISMNFKDVKMYGISNAVITKAMGFERDPKTSKFEIHASIPKLMMISKYKVEGRVLILPISGSGKANLTLDNVDVKFKFAPTVTEKNGKHFLQIPPNKVKLIFDISRLHLKLDNLFNGNQALGENMNQFLNENWQPIFQELKPAVRQTLINLLGIVINSVFDKLPYEDMFLDTDIDSMLCAKFPNDIKKCNYGDSKCIINFINDIFEKNYQGLPGIGLPSIDPIRIEKMDLIQGEKSPVNIALHFRDITFSGLSKAKVYKATGFSRNPQGDKIDIRFKAPKIAIQGPYKSKGRVLLLPVSGNGFCNMTLENVDFHMKLLMKSVERNGKIFMQIDKTKFNFETTRIYFYFTNLFNGNKELGDNMNSFLNENWKDILREMKASIIDGFGSVFKAIFSNVLNNFPYSEMFLN